jgi:hypothetical protein
MTELTFRSDSVINYYPANTAPKNATIDVGIGAHTDLQCFTFLWQDSVGGLEVLTKEGQWLKVPPVEDTFVVNIGDFLMRLSNDRFQSTVHRVFNYAPVERYSLPFFFGFNFNETCSVLPSCIDEEHPPKYEPIGCGKVRYPESFLVWKMLICAVVCAPLPEDIWEAAVMCESNRASRRRCHPSKACSSKLDWRKPIRENGFVYRGPWKLD